MWIYNVSNFITTIITLTIDWINIICTLNSSNHDHMPFLHCMWSFWEETYLCINRVIGTCTNKSWVSIILVLFLSNLDGIEKNITSTLRFLNNETITRISCIICFLRNKHSSSIDSFIKRSIFLNSIKPWFRSRFTNTCYTFRK